MDPDTKLSKERVKKLIDIFKQKLKDPEYCKEFEEELRRGMEFADKLEKDSKLTHEQLKSLVGNPLEDAKTINKLNQSSSEN